MKYNTIKRIIFILIVNVVFTTIYAQSDLSKLQEVTYYEINTIKDTEGNLKGYYMLFKYNKKAYKNKTFGIKLLDPNLETVGIKTIEVNSRPYNIVVSDNFLSFEAVVGFHTKMYRFDSDDKVEYDYDKIKEERSPSRSSRRGYNYFHQIYNRGTLSIDRDFNFLLLRGDGTSEVLLTFDAIDKKIGEEVDVTNTLVNGNKIFITAKTKKEGYLLVFDMDTKRIEHKIKVESLVDYYLCDAAVINEEKVAFIVTGIKVNPTIVVSGGGTIPMYEFFIYDPSTKKLKSKGVELEKSTITNKKFMGLTNSHFGSEILDNGRMVVFCYARNRGIPFNDLIKITDICMFEFNGTTVKAKSIEELDFVIDENSSRDLLTSSAPLQYVAKDENTNTIYSVAKTFDQKLLSVEYEDIIIYLNKDGKTTKLKVPLNKEAKEVIALEAKPGFYALFQYFEDDRGMQFELKKIPQF